MDKVYVVTRGENSDYRIITATTDEKLAYELKEKFDNKDGSEYFRTRVEVYENAQIYRQTCYWVRFDIDGNVDIANEEKYGWGYHEPEQENLDGTYECYVITEKLEKAIKIAAERRAMYLAKKYGL